MKDFVSFNVYVNIPYALSNCMSYDSLISKHQSYLDSFSNDTKPSTYAEAVKDPIWVEAIKKKILVLEDNKN